MKFERKTRETRRLTTFVSHVAAVLVLRKRLLAAFCACLLNGCLAPGASSAESLRDTFDRVKSSVVVVETKQRALSQRPSRRSESRFVDVAGLGSGVVVKVGDKVAVFTAAHVVQTADEVSVRFADKSVSPASVATSTPSADVALLELDEIPRNVRPVKLGNSEAVEVGDRVFVVGAPHGLTHTLTVGYIGARRRSNQIVGSMAYMELFQTDAAINAGNSGGPMFNADGEVIGIVSHILTHSGGFEGLGFAVTSNVARQLLIDEPILWSGVDTYLVRDDLARVFNLPQAEGLLVQRVAERSPGEALGLRAGTLHAQIGDEKLLVGGDIVLAVAGETIRADPVALQTIRARLRELKDNETLTVKILRGGKVTELSSRRGDL